MIIKLSYALLLVFILGACSSDPKVEPYHHSMSSEPPDTVMTYQRFRSDPINAQSDLDLVQKRFLILDRDNNGVLSQSEYSGF